MGFPYNQKYFQKHYSGLPYRTFLNVRNRFIRDEIRQLVPFGRMLEVGFGDDNLVRLFWDKLEVFGVDISPFALKNVREKYDAAHFKVCDISQEKIPFNERFDIIVAVNILEHLTNPVFALKNLYQSLQGGGIFVVYLPTKNNTFSQLLYRLRYDVEEHIFRPSIQSLRTLLGETGFSLCREYAADLLPVKVSSQRPLESLNLYLGFFKKGGL